MLAESIIKGFRIARRRGNRFICASILAAFSFSSANATDQKTILHIDSYHSGYSWSKGIFNGIKSRLSVENVRLRTIYIDSRRKRDRNNNPLTAQKILLEISTIKPDLILTSDDPAASFISEQSYFSKPLHHIYSGINWSADEYNFSRNKVTGITEAPLARSLVSLLSRHADGARLGYLGVDSIEARKDLKHFSNQLQGSFSKKFLVTNAIHWKRAFIELQTSVDLLILDNPEDIEGWDSQEMKSFVESEARIPIGSTFESVAQYSMISIATIPEEQGWWAADSAIKVLNGLSPADIPLGTSKEGKLIVNLKLAQILGYVIDQEVLEFADILK